MPTYRDNAPSFILNTQQAGMLLPEFGMLSVIL